MTIYDLKPKFQDLLRPIVSKLFNAGVTANQVTLAALLLSVIVGLVFLPKPSPIYFITVCVVYPHGAQCY